MNSTVICDAMAVPDFAQVAYALRLFPTKMETQCVYQEEDNCAIHEPFIRGSSADGCAIEAVGTHSSIRSLYRDDVVVKCFAEVGSRVRDAQLAALTVEMSDAFVKDAFARSKKYRKKYMQGVPVGVRVYGAGYCYLRMIDPAARSRAARILGPLPLVTDVLRMVVAVGNWNEDGFAMKTVTGGLLHVDAAKVTWRSSLRAVVSRMLQRVYENPYVRIGADEELTRLSYDRLGITGITPWFPMIAPSWHLMNAWGIQYGDQRAGLLRSWFRDRGIEVNETVFKSLLIATIAGPALPIVGGDELKRTRRMWAIVGDTAAKFFASTYSFASGDTPGSYTNCLKTHSNEKMAETLLISGLRECSLVGELSQESKANADIIEAVVGVFALYGEVDQCVKILKIFRLIPEIFIEPPDIDFSRAAKVVEPKLTSSQYVRFLEMYNAGAFGN